MSRLRRLNSERGMTLPELIIATTLMLIVMTATLTTLDSGATNRRLNDDRNDAVEQARASIDTVVRQLRNLATPTTTAPDAIDRAFPLDFSFRTFDPNKRLVRYCLQTNSNGSLITDRAVALIQMLSNTVAAGSYDSCTTSATDTPGWTSRKVVAQDVINKRSAPTGGGTPSDVDLFAYNSSSSDLSMIKNVRINLVVDINAANKRPAPVRLASGAALRNQNQQPLATFTVQNVSPRKFKMNGSSSSDPENRNLIFSWYAGNGANFVPDDTGSDANVIGHGSVLDYTFPAGVGTSTYYIKLVVSDSNLTDTCPTSSGDKTNCTTAGPWDLS
jgi:prepilin-type N-terminal cleavage/methylation domain-containing protein